MGPTHHSTTAVSEMLKLFDFLGEKSPKNKKNHYGNKLNLR